MVLIWTPLGASVYSCSSNHSILGEILMERRMRHEQSRPNESNAVLRSMRAMLSAQSFLEFASLFSEQSMNSPINLVFRSDYQYLFSTGYDTFLMYHKRTRLETTSSHEAPYSTPSKPWNQVTAVKAQLETAWQSTSL